MFLSDGLRGAGLDPASLYPYVQKRPAPLPVAGATIQRIPSSKIPKTPKHYAEVDDLVTLVKTEEEHELYDAMSPVYDQLDLAWFWWFLELLPVKQRYQKSDNTWETALGMNLGRGRFIPKQKKGVIKVHRSVKMRMDAQFEDKKKYIPKASFETALALGNVQWVD